MAKKPAKPEPVEVFEIPASTPAVDNTPPAEPAGPVTMVREHPAFPAGPVTADVHPDEVANWRAAGWRVA